MGAQPFDGRMESAYRGRTKASAAMAARAKAVIPGGTSHALRWYDPYPFFVARAQGSHAWDLDGNGYVDFWMGHWALILGHSPPVVVEALRRQMEEGTHWGMVSALEVEYAELIHEIVPCAERVVFTNTGSEANMYAVRLARGFTGGHRVLKLEGGWHGYNTDLIPGDRHRPSVGLPPDARSNVGTIPFNDLKSARAKIETTPDLAAVIIEPFLGGSSFITPDPEYLRGLREACDDQGCILIFDEVVTGFRLALGGAQEYYGVKPDLATFAKVLGGGLPAACIAGREDIMELANARRWGDKGKAVAIGGGTFSTNPLSMTAGLATVRYLKDHPDLYGELEAKGNRVRRGIEEALGDAKVPAECTGVESLFETHFFQSKPVPLRSYADVERATLPGFADGPLRMALLNRGFYTMHGGGAISAAHSDEELEALVAAIAEAAKEAVKAGEARG